MRKNNRAIDVRDSIEIPDPLVHEHVTHVPGKNPMTVRLTSGAVIALLIGALFMMAYAGADIGYLAGGFMIMSISYAIFHFMFKKYDFLTSALAGCFAMTFMFATNIAENIMGTSIQIGISLQRISTGGLWLLVGAAAYRFLQWIKK